MHAKARAAVALPPDEAWARLADLGALAQWAPDVASSPAEPLRAGATRWARLKRPAYGKDTLVERVLDADPRRRTFTYDIEGGIGPMAAIRTTWAVAAAPGGSEVTVSSEVGLAGALRLVPFLARRAWAKQLQELADAFAAWAPTATATAKGAAPKAK